MEAGDRLVSVLVQEAELNWVMDQGFSVITATSAVDWVVAEALRRAQGLTGRPGRPRIEPVRDGRVMPKDSHPDSWDGLAQFVNQGGQYRVTDRTLRGGADPDVQREQDGVRLAERLTSTETGAYYEIVASQEEPDQAQEVIPALGLLYSEPSKLFSSSVPVEALELLKEKELLALLVQAVTPGLTWPLPPPPHPPPPDAPPQQT